MKPRLTLKFFHSSEATNVCFTYLTFLESLCFRRSVPSPCDNDKLLANLKYQTELIVEFIEGSLSTRIKTYQIHNHFSSGEGDVGWQQSQNYKKLSLPAAWVWTATYILKSCHQQKPVRIDTTVQADDKSEECEHTINLRRSFLSLCWDMEKAKHAANDYNTRFSKFVSQITSALKNLKKSVHSVCKHKSSKETNGLVDFQCKSGVNKSRKKERELVLELEPNLRKTFPFVLSIDSAKTNCCFVKRNQACSELAPDIREEIITGFIKSTADSLERFTNLIEINGNRMDDEGIIIKGTDGTKDVTCYSTISTTKKLVAEALSKSRFPKLNESQIKQLLMQISSIFEKWNDYHELSHCAMLGFYELSDMITICYLYAINNLNMNIPDIAKIEAEVNAKLKFQKTNNKLAHGECNLKHYAIGTLIEECNQKSRTASTNCSAAHKPLSDNSFEQSLGSTKYPLVIQEYPLVFENSIGKYTIHVR